MCVFVSSCVTVLELCEAVNGSCESLCMCVCVCVCVCVYVYVCVCASVRVNNVLMRGYIAHHNNAQEQTDVHEKYTTQTLEIRESSHFQEL